MSPENFIFDRYWSVQTSKLGIIDRFVQADFTRNVNSINPWKTLMFAKLAWVEIF